MPSALSLFHASWNAGPPSGSRIPASTSNVCALCKATKLGSVTFTTAFPSHFWRYASSTTDAIDMMRQRAWTNPRDLPIRVAMASSVSPAKRSCLMLRYWPHSESPLVCD